MCSLGSRTYRHQIGMKGILLLNRHEGHLGFGRTRPPRHTAASPAQARAQDVQGDCVGLRVRACDDPKRHKQRQGRAERYNSRLELGRQTNPHLDDETIGLTRIAIAA